MVLDPQIDPGVGDQLYADLGPSLADNEYPVPWPPPHWGEAGQDPDAPVQPDEQIAPGITGPAPAGPFTPAEIAAAPPPGPDLTAPPPGPPPVDASLAGLPADQSAPGGGPLPPDSAAAMPAFGPQPEGAPQPPIGIAGPPAPPPGPVEMPYAGPAAAQLGPPPGPTVAGPVIPIAPEQLDLSETPTRESTVLGEYADHVLDIPDPVLRSKAFTELYTANPEEALRQKDLWDAKNSNDTAAALYRESERNAAKARANAEAWQAAEAKTADQMKQVNADVQRIANTKIDPGGGLSWWQKGAGILGAIVGGLYQGKTGAARNAGLDAYETVINRGIEAQKADLERQMQGAQMRKSLLGEEYARHGDMFRAQETVRMVAYEQAINRLQFEQQNYTAGGTTALRIANDIAELRQRQAATARTLGNEKFKQNLDQAKENRESALAISTIGKNQSEADKNEAEARKYLAKIGGGGAGAGAVNPNYTIPTGWFNPFDKTQPIFGKRQIGGKGEDPKERNDIGAVINVYAHAQDYWDELSKIGDEIGNAKSLGESVWAARRGTLGARYDAAKEALTVYLTRELRDKMTQGQLELQAHRIPDRASVFEARDPAAQIKAAQEDADRDFDRDMTQVGVDASGVIRSAQVRRMRVIPTPEQAADAARDALIRNPNDRDAQRAVAEADARVKAQVAAQQQGEADINAARKLPAAPPPISQLDASQFNPDSPYGRQERSSIASINAAVQDANRAASHYEAMRSKFNSLDSTAHLKGLKQPGDIAAATRTHEATLANTAADVLAAKQRADVAAAHAQELLKAKERQRYYERRQEAFAAGVNPDAPLPQVAPNALDPGRSYLPGADPFELPEAQRSVMQPKKGGRR